MYESASCLLTPGFVYVWVSNHKEGNQRRGDILIKYPFLIAGFYRECRFQNFQPRAPVDPSRW